MNLKDFPEYDEKKQINKWNYVKDSLTYLEKKNMIIDIIEQKDIWNYRILIPEILFDTSSKSVEFIEIMERLFSEIKNDLAQGPFLDSLVKIGSKKQNIALQLYDNITNRKDTCLILQSGLILGGFGLKHENTVLKIIEKEIQISKNIQIYQSFVKAILVMTENKNKINKRYQNIINTLIEKDIEALNIEIMNYSLANYSKKRLYFYKIIENMIRKPKERYKLFLFRSLTYQDIIEENKIFKLIELSKDSNEAVLDEIVRVMSKYPSKKKKILKLYIFWINKKHGELYFEMRNLSQVLEEIMKNDNTILSDFMRGFRKIKRDVGSVVIPDLFSKMARCNLKLSYNLIIEIKPKNQYERYLRLKLFRAFIGLCYNNKGNRRLMQKLAKYLIAYSKNQPYINVNINKKLISNTNLSQVEYNLLVDRLATLIEQLETRKKKINYNKIFSNLYKYPHLKEVSYDKLNKSRYDKKYTPLLWLLENEEPQLSEINTDNNETLLTRELKLHFEMDKFWQRAYLKELDNSIKVFYNIRNDKYYDIGQKRNYIKNILFDESSFWNHFTELNIINKLNEKYIIANDFEMCNKHYDILANIFNKMIIFEITAPRLDRNLELSDIVCTIKNKSNPVIINKLRDLKKSGSIEEIKFNNYLYYLMIDISTSTIDEYDLINSYYDKFPEAKYISGVIYFKRHLDINRDLNPKIKLLGNIINNPCGVNVLDESEINTLKKILFT